ncbi:MAG TPA: head GIN domain-containing protein [Flavisolibacter sp.]|nr:head GIN domain-containing protein [Flavisolibacter sp.]
MKKIFSLFLVGLLALNATAQEKVIYDANAEKRVVSPFHAIKVSHGIQLMIKQGNEEALAISAEKQEYANAVKTEVVNGELRIYIKQDMEKWWNQLRRKGAPVKAYVSFKNLDRLDASSGARTTIDGSLTSNKLEVDLSSGASLTGNVAVTAMDIELSSGAKSNVKGRVDNLSVETSSGAHFNGYDLNAVTARADASSGGKMELSVSKDLAASASSGGAINYKGNGGISNVSTSSGGKVRKAG